MSLSKILRAIAIFVLPCAQFAPAEAANLPAPVQVQEISKIESAQGPEFWIRVVVLSTAAGILTSTFGVSSDQYDPNLVNNFAVETTTVESVLKVDVLDNPDPVKLGELLTYTIVVNSPVITVTNLRTESRVPLGLAYLGLGGATPGHTSCGGSPVVCGLPELAPGEVFTVVIRTSVSDWYQKSEISFTTTVTADQQMTPLSESEVTMIFVPPTFQVYLPLIQR